MNKLVDNSKFTFPCKGRKNILSSHRLYEKNAFFIKKRLLVKSNNIKKGGLFISVMCSKYDAGGSNRKQGSVFYGATFTLPQFDIVHKCSSIAVCVSKCVF